MDTGLSSLDPKLMALRDEHSDRLLGNNPTVTGVGIGYAMKDGKLTDEVALLLYVARKYDPPATERFPRTIDGIRVDVIEQEFVRQTLMGNPVIKDDPQRKNTLNPMVGGISVGPNYLFSENVGTLGFIGVDVDSGKEVIVSNQHVLTYRTPKSGDEVSQCSRVDSTIGLGTKAGLLKRWIDGETIFQGVPYGIDAASAEIVDGRTTSRRQIIGLSEAFGEAAYPELGDKVFKVGYASGGTFGTVSALGVNVTHSDDKKLFRNQFTVTSIGIKFSETGDSGSLILRAENDGFVPVGLLWGSAFPTCRAQGRLNAIGTSLRTMTPCPKY